MGKSSNTVVYQGSWYIQSISATLALFMLGNAYALSLGVGIAVVPMVIQLALLFLIGQHHEFVPFLIKAWCVMLMFGGGCGVLATTLGVVDLTLFGANEIIDNRPAVQIILDGVHFMFGLIYFMFCSDYVKVIPLSKLENKSGGS